MKKAARLAILLVFFGVGASYFWWANSPEPAPTPAPPHFKLPPPPVWKVATPAQQKAAQKSIVAQLQAFKADRYGEAAKYQSRGLRQNFASVEEFRTVIQKSYPQFASFQSVRFQKARTRGAQLEIGVRLVGTDGVKQNATYLMVRENGMYHVAGVSGGLAPRNDAPQNEDAGDLI